MEASEGAISVHSEGKGKGSLFYFTMKLPITDPNDLESDFAYNDNSLQFNNLSNIKRMGMKKKNKTDSLVD